MRLLEDKELVFTVVFTVIGINDLNLRFNSLTFRNRRKVSKSPINFRGER